MSIQPGQLFGNYRVEGPIGSGGQADVWLVRHVQLGSLAALKVLRLSSPALERRLLQEGRVQAALRHPNIVSVMDVVVVGDGCGLIVEYIDGPSLEHGLETNRPSLAEAEALFADIVRAVEQAHDRGIVHRDLKPANVLLATVGGALVAKVADFGLARVFLEVGSGTRTGATMGTLRYMAPEQVRDASTVDERADLFSLGCILYELVTGAPPFDSLDLIAYHDSIAHGDWVLPSLRVPGIPARIDAAISACLVFDREKRVAGTRELMTLIDGVPRPRPTGQPSGGVPSGDGQTSRTFAPVSAVDPPGRDRPGQTAAPVQMLAAPTQRGPEPGLGAGGSGKAWRRGAGAAAILLLCVAAATAWWARPPDESPGTDVTELPTPSLPSDAVPVWRALHDAYRAGDEQEMARLSEQLVQLAPDSGEAWLRRASLLGTLSVTVGKRDPASQREALVKAEARRSALSGRDRRVLDIVKASNDQVALAEQIRLADEAVAAFPDDAELRYLRFQVEPASSAPAAREALRLDPGFGWAAMDFADSLSGEPAEQAAVLDQCLLHHPSSPACHRVRQIWSAYRRDCQAVSSDVDAWLAGSPHDPRALRARAQALLHAGAPIEAAHEALRLSRSFGASESESEHE